MKEYIINIIKNRLEDCYTCEELKVNLGYVEKSIEIEKKGDFKGFRGINKNFNAILNFVIKINNKKYKCYIKISDFIIIGLNTWEEIEEEYEELIKFIKNKIVGRITNIESYQDIKIICY